MARWEERSFDANSVLLLRLPLSPVDPTFLNQLQDL
jgi:hypothetical protein